MSAGLDASMVTPGRTAPEESLTAPTIEAAACAWAMTGITTSMTRTRIALMNLSLVRALPDWPKAWIAKQTDNEGIIGFLIDPPRIGSSPHDFGQGDSPTLIAVELFWRADTITPLLAGQAF